MPAAVFSLLFRVLRRSSGTFYGDRLEDCLSTLSDWIAQHVPSKAPPTAPCRTISPGTNTTSGSATTALAFATVTRMKRRISEITIPHFFAFYRDNEVAAATSSESTEARYQQQFHQIGRVFRVN